MLDYRFWSTNKELIETPILGTIIKRTRFKKVFSFHLAENSLYNGSRMGRYNYDNNFTIQLSLKIIIG